MEVVVSHIRNLRIAVAVSAVALAVTFAPASTHAAVCNEAGNAHLGGSYVVMGTPDPSIPARNTSGLKELGNGKANGLANAAERSPALSECGLPGEDSSDRGAN
jgi:hypothetical protein